MFTDHQAGGFHILPREDSLQSLLRHLHLYFVKYFFIFKRRKQECTTCATTWPFLSFPTMSITKSSQQKRAR